MKKEVEDLFKLSGKKFDDYLDQLRKKYKDDPVFKKILTDYMKSRLVLTGQRLDKIEDMINLREQLNEVSKIISLSYISKNYFGKTKSWLYQRINGNIVNGKRSSFTESELKQFNKALKDIGKKIGSLSIG